MVRIGEMNVFTLVRQVFSMCFWTALIVCNFDLGLHSTAFVFVLECVSSLGCFDRARIHAVELVWLAFRILFRQPGTFVDLL